MLEKKHHAHYRMDIALWSATGEIIRLKTTTTNEMTKPQTNPKKVSTEPFIDMDCKGNVLFNNAQASEMCPRICEMRGKYYNGEYDASGMCGCVSMAYKGGFGASGQMSDEPSFLPLPTNYTNSEMKESCSRICALRPDCGYAMFNNEYSRNSDTGCYLRRNASDIQYADDNSEYVLTYDAVFKNEDNEMVQL